MREITWEEINRIKAGIEHYYSLFQGLEYRQDVANAEGQEDLNAELNKAIEEDAA